MLCEWCEADSGRTNQDRLCCKLRSLAKSPPDSRQEHFKVVLINEGKDVANTLIAETNLERKRLHEVWEAKRKLRSVSV